jgi:hypothetical protein
LPGAGSSPASCRFYELKTSEPASGISTGAAAEPEGLPRRRAAATFWIFA